MKHKQPNRKPNCEEDSRSLFTEPPFPQMRQENGIVGIVPAQIVLAGRDGFTNQLAGLGAASPLMAAGTFVRSGLTNQQEMLTTLYRENSIAKRIIDRVSEDITRGWYTLSSARLDEEDLSLLKDLEALHNIKQEITDAIRWGRLYGGSIAIMVIAGEEDRMDQPLKPEQLPQGCFKGLYVVDLTQGITPSLELEDDLDDPDFGLPKYYDVETNMEGMRCVRIHHSRVLRFIGRELPEGEMEKNAYWGASELEHMMDELMRYASICANISQLAFKANLYILKSDNLAADLAYGSDRLKASVERAIQQENRMRTSYGVQIMNAGDSMENHSYSFAGLPEIKESMMLDIAGAAEIPVTIMFGRSPQGMNATGEADIRNYYDRIAQLQERVLRPAMEKLLPVMAVSCWSFVPDDMKILFNPVMTCSPKENAELSSTITGEVIAAMNSGLITLDEARAELRTRGAALGNWGNIH